MTTKLVGVGLAAALSFAASFALTRSASAACTNDVDCPVATCGGQVCQWPAHACVAAGTDPQASDGWCTVDSDCKCMGAGATCGVDHCTFTLPRDAGVVPVVDAGETPDAASVEPEASAPIDDAGAITFIDANVTSGADSSVPPVGPDAGPMGSTVSGGCAIGGTGGSGWSLALGAMVAFAGRRRRRASR